MNPVARLPPDPEDAPMIISIQHNMEHMRHIQLRTDEPEDDGGAGPGTGPGLGTGPGVVEPGTGVGGQSENNGKHILDCGGHPGSTCLGTRTPF